LHELNEEKPTKTGSLQMIKQVAKQLGNTPAVCRKCYIHPAVLESYLAGSLQLKWTNASKEPAFGMWAIERELIRFLDGRRREMRSGATLRATLRASLGAAKPRRARGAHGLIH
jgi:DNA topoisomerase IB